MFHQVDSNLNIIYRSSSTCCRNGVIVDRRALEQNKATSVSYLIRLLRQQTRLCSYINSASFIILFLCLSSLVQASNIRFQRLLNGEGKDGGEIINTVHVTAQDKDGFIWFGGEKGVARYDGHAVKIYQHNIHDPSTIASNAIWDIKIDHDNEVWFATSDGLSRYESSTDSFVNTYSDQLNPNSLPNNSIRSLLVDGENNLYIATDGGLSILNAKRDTFTNYSHNPQDENSLTSNTVRKVFIDDDGVVWLGLDNKGLVRFDRKNKQFKRFQHNPLNPNSLVHDNIVAITQDKHNQLWLGSLGGGVSRMDIGSENFTNYLHVPSNKHSLGSNTIWNIFEDSFDNLWFATDHGGLARYREDTDDFEHFRHNAYDDNSISSNKVRSIYEDRQGDLWIGTFPVGVNFYDRSSTLFEHLSFRPDDTNTLSNSSITDITETRDGMIWIATEGGLNRYDPKAKTFKRYLANPENPFGLKFNAVLSVEEDAEGQLWVGTWSGGLHRFDRKTERFYNYFPDPNDPHSLPSQFIWSILHDQDNNLWVGSERGGLSLYRRESDDFYHFPQAEWPDEKQISNPFVWTMMEDSRGNIWVGTLDGLDKMEKKSKTFVHYRYDAGDPQSISNNRIVSLFEASDKRIWIGTQGGGLNIYDPNTDRFSRLGKENGLPSVSVASIIEDNNKDIWITTDKGIARISPRDLKIKTFEKSHGLVGNNHNRNASFKDSAGRLYLGSTEGITIFDPQTLIGASSPPPIALTEFRIFNKIITPNTENSPLKDSITNTKQLNLNHKHGVFSFEFAALSYRSSVKNQYAYILKGFDKEWNYVGNSHSAVYTNIDPGHYKFIVKGANSDGIWNETGASIDVIISPPPWKTWWAYLLYILASLLVAYSIIRNQMKRVELEKERSVNAQLIQIDRMKDAFLANTSHELRTPLNGIIGLAESLVENQSNNLDEQSRYHLRMIVSSSQRLASLINDILDLSKLGDRKLGLKKSDVDLFTITDTVIMLLNPLVGKKQIDLINEIPHESCIVYADENRLQQIMVNLVGNAIKYTDKGHVKVSCVDCADGLLIEIEDTGIGIPASQADAIFESFNQIETSDAREYGGTGLGLTITKELVELHGGTVNVSSIPGEGSKFSFTIPSREQDSQNQTSLMLDVKKPGSSQASNDNARKIAITADAKSDAQNSKNPIDRPTNKAIINSSFETPKDVSAELPKLENASDYTILIVDDDPVNRMVLLGILGLCQYTVIEADNGPEALKILREDTSIDLVILDVMMPNMTGYQCCEEIRKFRSRQYLPIIFLTAKDFDCDLAQSFSAGGNDFVNKPVKKKEILARVHIHLTNLIAFREANNIQKRLSNE